MSDGTPPPRYDPAWTASALFGQHGTAAAAHTHHQGAASSPVGYSAFNEPNDQTPVLHSYYAGLDSNPDTPSSPIPLILLQNGGSGYQILGPDQIETRPVSPETTEPSERHLLSRATSSSSSTPGSSCSSSLSSPPSYPDSPPSYPESPPSYPHSPPTYPCDNPPTYPLILAQCPPPREVAYGIMSAQVPSSSSGGCQITEVEGSHTSLSHEPVGSRNSLSQPLSATSGGSRSSLTHPVVVRTGSRNSLSHQPLGSRNSLNQPMNRRASTRHSFHHPPSSRTSPLIRTSSSHGPRTSPLHRDINVPILNSRAVSPSPFFPHNVQEPTSTPSHELDPLTAAPPDGGPVTLILQDINPDSTAIYLTHVDHPSTCQLIDPNALQQILLAEGQRDIDQFEGDPKRRMRLRNVCLVFWSLTCHLAFFVCVGLLIWQVPLKRRSDLLHQVWANHPATDQRGPKPQPLHSETTLICASVLLVICYLFSWIESCVSDTHRYIDNKMELTRCRMYVRRMRMTVPKLRWTIDCYHWGSEDTENLQERNKGQNEKVVTHTEVEEFPFTVCKDASGDLGTFKKGGINRFEFEKTFGFVNEATAAVYEQRKEAFLQRNMSMDRHHTFKEIFELEGMESHVTVYVERGHLTKLMSFHLYSCLTCCLLTWPYRILFRCFTKKRKFTFVKLLGL